MCGSSDSFPAPLRLRGRKGENFGPPDMNFPEEPIVGTPIVLLSRRLICPDPH